MDFPIQAAQKIQILNHLDICLSILLELYVLRLLVLDQTILPHW